VLSDRLSQEKLVRMAPGDSVTLSGYTFHFLGTETVQGPNFSAQRATFRVERDGESLELRPEKRNYKVQRNMMTEAAIDAGLSRDLYVALGEPLDKTAWSVRLYVKPFIRWIWAGGLFMIAGGLLSVGDRRYRLPLREARAVPERAAARAT